MGATGDRRTISWTSKDALLYAVGIGAGQDHLRFSTENTKDTPQVVYPTFAVVAGSGTGGGGRSALSQVGDFNWAMLVHGSQSVTLAGPIPVEAEAIAQDRVAAIYDKGKAAVVGSRTRSRSPTVDRCGPRRRRSSFGAKADGAATADRPAPRTSRSNGHPITS